MRTRAARRAADRPRARAASALRRTELHDDLTDPGQPLRGELVALTLALLAAVLLIAATWWLM